MPVTLARPRDSEIRDMTLVIEPLIPRLRRYARSLVADRSTADDLVQDCLERAIRGWPGRRADGDARAWLFTILHNVAMNHIRQLQRRGTHVALDDAGDNAVGGPPRQEDTLHLGDLMTALAKLPADQRSVVLLVSVEDLSYEQVARVLDVPIGTVMSRLSRGRQKLLQVMDSERKAPTRTAYLRRVK